MNGGNGMPQMSSMNQYNRNQMSQINQINQLQHLHSNTSMNTANNLNNLNNLNNMNNTNNMNNLSNFNQMSNNNFNNTNNINNNTFNNSNNYNNNLNNLNNNNINNNQNQQKNQRKEPFCKLATRYYSQCLKQINPNINIVSIKKPLIFPNEPVHNNFKDNEKNELIVFMDDLIGSAHSREGNASAKIADSSYRIISSLGSGTFGQVLQCEDLKTHKRVAIKILKNNPRYFRQGMLEIAMLECANLHNQNDDKHIVKIIDHFLYHRHICIVFELLGINLYEVIKANGNKGMGLAFTLIVGIQILKALFTLKKEGIIHCDLKPENIMMINLNSTNLKVIDIGSACFENHTLYNYIQSRHYRAPEIILGLPYTTAIDMWSFGCVIAELLLGIPIFPGENEYNQLVKIMTMIGQPSKEMLDRGTKTDRFFKKVYNQSNPHEYEYVLKTGEEYAKAQGIQFSENKRYHQYKTLYELCCGVKMHKNGERKENDEKMRAMLYDFLTKILVYDPVKRFTPDEAAAHPLMKLRSSQDTSFDWVGVEFENMKEINLNPSECAQRILGHCPPMNSMASQNYGVEKYYQIYTKGINKGIILNVLSTFPFASKPLRCFVDVNEEEDEMNISSFEFSENDLPPNVLGSVPERCRSKSISYVEVEGELPSIGVPKSNNMNVMKISKQPTISNSYNSNSFFRPSIPISSTTNGNGFAMNGMNQNSQFNQMNGVNARSGSSTPRRRNLMTPTQRGGYETLRPPDDGFVRQSFGGMKHPQMGSSNMNGLPMMQQQNNQNHQQSQFQNMMHPMNGQNNLNLHQRQNQGLQHLHSQPNLQSNFGNNMNNGQMQINGIGRQNSLFTPK